MPAMLDSPFPDLARRVVACRKCPRLVRYLAGAPERYWGRPVPAWGDPRARLLLVGLAPGWSGSNRTGRPFTGDASGQWLFRALHAAGFADRPVSVGPGDGMKLHDCAITAAARCAPPGNRPTPRELETCRPYLAEEFERWRPRVVVALGHVAHDAVLKVLGIPRRDAPFAHGRWHPAARVLDSYHPSRQNTNTGVLTWRMWIGIFRKARKLLAISC